MKLAAYSYPMQRMLAAILLHGDPGHYLRGRSEHGGANGTRHALFTRGAIDGKGNLTEQGREAAEASAKNLDLR